MTRSQAVALPDPANAAVAAKLNAAYIAIGEASTPTAAADIANQSRILAAAVRASDQSLEVQNEAARLRLTAERRLGALLLETVVAGRNTDGTQLPEGVSRQRSSIAQKLARIDEATWATWIENTLAADQELTQAAAIRMAPVAPREDRKTIADTYAAPSIDVQLAREWGLEASDERAELIVQAVQTGLKTMANTKHAYVWSRYHGLQDDGTIGEAWTFEGIAKTLGTSRPYVESLYYRASHHIRGAIAVEALNTLSQHMAAA
jgi:hypothetical protein